MPRASRRCRNTNSTATGTVAIRVMYTFAGSAPSGSPSRSRMTVVVSATRVAHPATSTGATARRCGVLARSQRRTSNAITVTIRGTAIRCWRLIQPRALCSS